VIAAIAVVGYLLLNNNSSTPDVTDSIDNDTSQQNEETDQNGTDQTSSETTDNTSATDGVKNPNVFVQASIGDADTLDPIHAYDTSSGQVIMNIYENLIAYDGPKIDTFAPMLATEVPTVENGLVNLADDGTMAMTFPIRTGVFFHNGDEMKPEDVAYSFRRIMVHSHPDSPAWILLEDLLDTQDLGDVASNLGDEMACQKVLDAVVVDGQNVTFNFPQPSATFLTRIAQGGSWGVIENKSFVVNNGGWNEDCSTWRDHYQVDKVDLPLHQITSGTGPFKLERWTTDDVIVLVRNDEYWREPASLARAELQVVPEFGTRKLMFEQGDADMIYVDRQDISQMQGLANTRTIYDLLAIQNTTAFFNYDIPTDGNPNVGSAVLDGEGIPADFFTDLDVRKAFSYSFNWDEFIEQVWLGEATKSFSAIPAALPYVNKENPTYYFDTAKAEEHFKAAWGGEVWEKGFKFSIVFNEGNQQRRIAAEILKDNIEALNDKFLIEVRAEPWPTYLDNMRGRKIPIFITGWRADFPDAHNFVQPYMHSQGAYAVRQSLSKVANYDDLIMAAAREIDNDKRADLYKELQMKAYEDAIDIFLIDPTDRNWQRTWLNNWTYNAMWPGMVRYLYGLSKVADGQLNSRVLTDVDGAKETSW
jgi:peptide/nickel transport system substrate-binding protein